MLRWLGAACAQARRSRGRKQVQVAIALGVDQRTISRFERGQTWPRSPDEFISAYAEDIGVDPLELWADAVASWRESNT